MKGTECVALPAPLPPPREPPSKFQQVAVATVLGIATAVVVGLSNSGPAIPAQDTALSMLWAFIVGTLVLLI